MRIAIVALVVSLLTTIDLSAQTAPSRNAVYGEVFGNAILGSVNYERRFTDRIAGRVGFFYVPSEDDDGDNDHAITVPLMVNFISSPRSKHHLEAGAGFLFIAGNGSGFMSDVDEDFSSVAGTATLGYRMQPPEGGFLFRAGFTPVFDGSDVLPWFGVSFGYAW